jgi:hypothetical protein
LRNYNTRTEPIHLTGLPLDQIPPDTPNFLTDRTYHEILDGLACGVPVTKTLRNINLWLITESFSIVYTNQETPCFNFKFRAGYKRMSITKEIKELRNYNTRTEPIHLTGLPIDQIPPDTPNFLTDRTYHEILDGLACGVPVTKTLRNIGSGLFSYFTFMG